MIIYVTEPENYALPKIQKFFAGEPDVTVVEDYSRSRRNNVVREQVESILKKNPDYETHFAFAHRITYPMIRIAVGLRDNGNIYIANAAYQLPNSKDTTSIDRFYKEVLDDILEQHAQNA